MAMQAPPPQPGLFSTINWHSPMTYLVIVGGGIALYLLWRHFMANAGSATAPNSSSNAAAPGTGSTGFTEENIYEQTLAGPNAQPAPPKKAKGKPIPRRKLPRYPKGKNPPPLDPPVTKFRHARMTADQADVQDVEIDDQADDNSDVPNGTAQYDREALAHGTGPGAGNYLHVPTWPYGGQRVRPRLG